MDLDRRWGLSLELLMFLTITTVHCQNQTNTTPNILGTTFPPNATSTTPKLEEIVPGTLKIGSGNVFEAPQIFPGQPFSLKTDPVTGEVDFQTKTVDVQTVNAAKEHKEAQKVAELQEDIRSRIPSEDLPIEARDEEYEDEYEQPNRRADVDYYEEEEPAPPPKGYTPRPITTPKEEDSFMSIFESLFGGGEEEKKEVEEVRPSQPFIQPFRKPAYPSTPMFTTEIRTTQRPTTTVRYTETTTARRTTERPSNFQHYQEPPNRYQQPERFHAQTSFYNPAPNRIQERPITQQLPYRNPEPLSFYQKPNPYQTQRPLHAVEKSTPQAIIIEKERLTTTTTTTTTTSTTQKPVVQQNRPEHLHLKESNQEVNYQSNNDWHSVNNGDNHVFKKDNIDRQDVEQNEIKPVSSSSNPDYYNFINLPVHYSTKDTAIPLISTSYANTKIQGMGAGKYEKTNNGKFSNHKYDSSSSTTTSKRPSYWSTRKPPTSRPTAPRQPVTSSSSVNYENIDYDEVAIGSSADFGGYGNKAGVQVQTEPTRTTTRTTPTKQFTTTSTSTTTRTTPVRTTSTQPAPVKEYADYDYESYPAQVRPVQNPMNTPKPVVPSSVPITNPTTQSTTTEGKKTQAPPKDTEYEYYDYDTEAPLTTTPKYKIRYPSLSKEKIKRPDEKVAVVVPTKIETKAPTTSTTTTTTSSTTTSTTTVAPQTTSRYNPRPSKPAPVFEENEHEQPSRPPVYHTTPKEVVTPIIVTAGKRDPENVNIVLVPAKTSTTEQVNIQSSSRRPDLQRPNQMVGGPDYTTEFTVGAVQGNEGHPGLGHFVASSIAASPYDEADGPFRPIPRPPGMTASFQVIGDDDDLKQQSSNGPTHFHQLPQEPDVHEEHEFIPSPQFHRPDPNHFIVGTSFNTKPASPALKTPDYYPQPPPPPKKEVLGVKPKPQRPGFFNPPPPPVLPPSSAEESDFIVNKKPGQQYGPKPPIEEEYYKATNKPNYYTPKPAKTEEEFGFYDKRPSNNKQTNVELSVDYDFDGIQTQPKPGEYVIFPKPQLNPEMNENQLKKSPNTPLPHYSEKTTTETTKPIPTQIPITSQEKTDPEKQQEMAPNYPRPHWEKKGKPSFLLNSQGPSRPHQGQPLMPQQMSPNLIPPGNMPPRFRKPVTPPNLPPVRKNFNEVNFQTKPKPNLPNILPQFRPNAKLSNGHRPHRYPPPNRRQENFPYRIQTEPDALMHRDFEVEEEIIPKFITNRVKIPEYEHMMLQKRLGEAAPPQPPQRRLQRTPVTTLQMLQQNKNIKKQQMPITREDQPDPTVPLLPPAYKPFKDEKKDVFLVYPLKTPFNSNIKIEDPEKIEYNYNQSSDQVPLLKPSKKKEKLKPDFPYGFVTPEERPKEQRKDNKQQEVKSDLQDYMPIGPKGSLEDVRPNIQDYMPSSTKVLNEKQERIDMNLHMQSNNQWNQVSTYEEPPVITRQEDVPPQGSPPTQYHTLLKNTNASEFTLGAVMHTLPEKGRPGQVSSVSLHEENPSLIRPGLNVNERISNGKIVTVSMPLDVKEEKEDSTGFQAPFQASSSVQQGSQGWNFVQKTGEGGEDKEDQTTESANATTFNFENFKPELIGGFKPLYNQNQESENSSERDRTVS